MLALLFCLSQLCIYLEGVDQKSNRIENLLEDVIEQKIAEGNGSQMVDVVLLDLTLSSVHNSVFRGNGERGVKGPWQHARKCRFR